MAIEESSFISENRSNMTKPTIKTTAWYLENPKGENPRIRRTIFIDGKRKLESHPQAKFLHILSDIPALKDYVIRLNGKDPRAERVKARLEFEHAFISPSFLDEYQNTYLRNAIPSEKEAAKLVFYLRNYVLNYFVARLGIASPIEWKRNESLWGLALLNKQKKNDAFVFEDGESRSTKVLKIIVYESNRFMRFIHTKHPDIPAITFEPLSKAVLKSHEANRRLKGEVRDTKYIPAEDWKVIKANLPDTWGCLIKLCYYYGLRRNEAYGLSLKDVKNGYLAIEKQLDKIADDSKKYKPLKSRYTRKCPHWFCKPQEAHKLANEIAKLDLHPDSLSQLFVAKCESLKLPHYTIHDLRRTFITNAVNKGIKQEDLRLAVGHVDGATTYKYYVRDTRDMNDEEFEPEED